jgi:hypothetical protein
VSGSAFEHPQWCVLLFEGHEDKVEGQVERDATESKRPHESSADSPAETPGRTPKRKDTPAQRLLTAHARVWLPCGSMEAWRYGLTLLPREKSIEEQSAEETVEAVVRSRQDLGWELVRVSARDNAELLIFRRPA